MQKVRVRLNAALASIMAGAALHWAAALLSARDQAPPPSQLADRWAINSYEEALGLLLPLTCAPDTDSQGSAQWRVTARGRPAHSYPPEYLLTLTKHLDGSVEGSLAHLDSPLLPMLRELRIGNPDAALQALASHIRVNHHSFGGTASSLRLRRLARRFERLRPRLPLDSSIALDSRHYEVCVVGGAEVMSLSLLGPSNGKAADPVIKWIEATRQELLDAESPGPQSATGGAFRSLELPGRPGT